MRHLRQISRASSRAGIPVKLPPPRRPPRRSSSGWWPPSGFHRREPVQSPLTPSLICVKDRSAAGINPRGNWVLSLVQVVFRGLANGFGQGHRLAAALEGSPHRRLPGPAATWTLEERLERPISPCNQRNHDKPATAKIARFFEIICLGWVLCLDLDQDSYEIDEATLRRVWRLPRGVRGYRGFGGR